MTRDKVGGAKMYSCRRRVVLSVDSVTNQCLQGDREGLSVDTSVDRARVER